MILATIKAIFAVEIGILIAFMILIRGVQQRERAKTGWIALKSEDKIKEFFKIAIYESEGNLNILVFAITAVLVIVSLAFSLSEPFDRLNLIIVPILLLTIYRARKVYSELIQKGEEMNDLYLKYLGNTKKYAVKYRFEMLSELDSFILSKKKLLILNLEKK